MGRNEGGYFYGCSNLTTVPTSGLILTGTTSLFSCFRGCSNFNSNISSWNTSQVTDISYMFINATAFNNGGASGTSSIPLSWDTSQVINTGTQVKSRVWIDFM